MSKICRCTECGWEGVEPKVVMESSKWNFDDNTLYENAVCPECGELVEEDIDPVREERNRLKWEEVSKGDKKVVRDGKVAVLISRGYGAGWSTWNYGYQDILLFHPLLVKMVEEGRNAEITEEWLEEEMGLTDIFVGDSEGLTIRWLPEGTKFLVEEYDGAESITTEESLVFTA